MPNPIEADIKTRLVENDFRLSERLGQHFLIDQAMIDLFVANTLPGSRVIEVGSGIGHVTEAIAQKADSIIGIEIDRRFQPALEDVQARNPNMQFTIADVLHVPFSSLIEKGGQTQIVANIPFHITEPLLRRLIDLPISNAILIVGDAIADELQASEYETGFGTMSLLAQTFFDITELTKIPRTSFFPPPRTEASMISLDPRDKRELEKNPSTYIFSSLFRKAGKYGLVKNDLKQTVMAIEERADSRTLSKKESHQRNRAAVKRELRQFLSGRNGAQMPETGSSKHSNTSDRNLVLSQSQALDVIRRMGISETILEKPFFRLSNNEIRELTIAVRGYYR